MSKVANKLRSHIRINNEWGRVVEGQTDDMALAADLLDEAEKALLYARDEIGKHKPTSSGVDALNQVKRTLARIRGEKA